MYPSPGRPLAAVEQRRELSGQRVGGMFVGQVQFKAGEGNGHGEGQVVKTDW
ncbi:hypothetical protein L544_3830 [Bordetella hinzii OH87 BAL007II]|uniref:Uncharacterized protein n=1 Tax=Bordetella hinzii OH87 BAL007II TaxID=1331262 RepID=A0ABR4QXJ0_9BORD|nr:hypothetical protein L544_3830 [Bordetella hinzii OH87 BAL007II]